MKTFNVINNKGFQLKVNGWVISTMFGAFNYCENRSFWGDVDTVETHSRLDSEDAEVAVWRDEKGRDEFNQQWMLDLGYVDSLEYADTVMGHINSDDLVKIINWCATH